MRSEDVVARLREYRAWVRLAEAQTGKGLLTQAREIRALKRAGGRCGVTDYYWFRLYDAAYQRGRGAPDFLGWRLQDPFNFSLNPRHAVLPAWDKRVFHQLASAAGLPVVPLKATFYPGGRLPEEFGRLLRNVGEAAAFLRQPESYPLFAKPAHSQQGVGALHLSAYDPAADDILLADGGRLAVNDFVPRLVRSVDPRYHRPECGFLFQEALRLPPEIEDITGWPAICGVRIVCLNDATGVRLIGAVWKIAVPPNTVDNFHLGAYGNLVAEVDIETGEIGRVVNGLWPYAAVLASHPVTGKAFDGFRLPDWNQLTEICHQAGPMFPLMKAQHWDFALTDKGPVILELNDMGGTQIAQLHGRGLLTETTREFLKRHADRRAHPWVDAL